MRRHARYTLNALTVLSLLLCVVTVALWVRSYSALHGVERATPRGHHSMGVSRGEIYVEVVRYVGLDMRAPDSPAKWDAKTSPAEDLISYAVEYVPAGRPPTAGFFFGRDPSRVLILLPIAFVVAALAALPLAVAARHVRRHHHAAAGRCESCGYDLRATPHRCPECGTVPKYSD